MTVVKGFNSDICFHGRFYHVQTEDWGESKSSIVTKVFKNGAVIKTVVSNYKDLMNKSFEHNSHNYTINQKEDCIRSAMQIQHRKILDLLHSGQLLQTNQSL